MVVAAVEAVAVAAADAPDPSRPPPVPPGLNQDEEHLRYLGVGYYVVGGLTALFACFPLIHLAVGLLILFSPEAEDAEMVGVLFAVMGGGMFLFGQIIAAGMVYTGRLIRQRRNHTVVFVVSCVMCAFAPLGTVLGVLGILVLMRPSVKALFGLPPSPVPAG